MRFQKISNNSIRCIITQQELDAQGVEIDDLMDNREKAEGFLRYILREAKNAVDFRTSGNVLNVQMSIMPDGDIQMMISDDTDSAIRSMLSEMKNHLQELSAQTRDQREDGDKNPPLWGSDDFEALSDAMKETGGVSLDDVVQSLDGELESAEDINTLPLWAHFDSLDACIRMAHQMPDLVDFPSRLYLYQGIYYLEMELTLSRIQLAGTAFKVAEYSDGMYSMTPGVLEIVEHGKVIIKDHAVKALYELSL